MDASSYDHTLGGSPDAPPSAMQVFCRSLALVGVAELFDKTWFMGLLLALRYRALTVFTGSISALLLHTVLAAALGYAFAKVLSRSVLNFLAFAIFLIFTVLYARDWYNADPDGDAIAAGREDAEEECMLDSPQDDDNSSVKEGDGMQLLPMEAGDNEDGKAGRARSSQAAPQSECLVFSKSFTAIFIAEWGDRTQIAMVGQHASQPLIPVFLGSSLAFFLLTLSAVGAATLLSGRKLSERLVYGVSTVCFAVFALFALKDALVSISVI